MKRLLLAVILASCGAFGGLVMSHDLSWYQGTTHSHSADDTIPPPPQLMKVRG